MIAKEAGVSVMTVSNVINGKQGKVSATTRAKIEEIIKKYNYTPNQNARTLVGAKSRLIGLIFHATANGFVDNPYYGQLIGMIEPRLGQEGYFLLVKSTQTIQEALSVIKTWNVEGVIFVGLFERDVIAVKNELKIPFICLDTFAKLEGITCISADDQLGGYEATHYLIENGHEKLLFLSPKINQDGVVKERYEGFQRALTESGLLHQAKYLEVEKCTLEAGKNIAKQVAQLEVTAVLVTADILAIGLIQGLKMLGKSVPDDISVIGFDNLEVSQLITPSLSSIDQQLSKKVDVAIQQLVKLLKSPDCIGEVIKIKPNLVSRESVKVLNR